MQASRQGRWAGRQRFVMHFGKITVPMQPAPAHRLRQWPAALASRTHKGPKGEAGVGAPRHLSGAAIGQGSHVIDQAAEDCKDPRNGC